MVVSSRIRRGAEVFGHRLATGLADRGWWTNLVALTDDAVPDPIPATPLAPIEKADAGRLDRRILGGLRRAVAEHKPDVVVAYGGPTLRYLAAAYAWRRHRPRLVYVSIGEPKYWIRTPVQRLIYKAAMRRMDRCLAVTDTTARQLIDYLGIPEEMVGVAPTGVPDEYFTVEPAPPHKSVNLLFMGSLSEEKGPAEALEAFAAANGSGRGRLRFVGDGPLRASLEARARQPNVSGVEFVGSVADVKPHLGWADVLISTSQTEGLPGVILEAAAAGIPTIAYGVGGTDQALQDGVTGHLLPPGDRNALESAIRDAIAEPARLAEQGEAAQRMAAEGFTISRSISTYNRELIALTTNTVPTVAHLTTVDSSLRYLLSPQLGAVIELGGKAVGISAPGPDVPALESAGIEHIPLRSSTRSFRIRQDLKATWELWRVLRKLRPDILHTHNPKPGLYGRILGRLAGVPVVVNTIHGLYATETDRWLKRLVVYALEAIAARFSHAELSQSQEDFALLTRRHIVPAAKIRHLGNGISIARFDPAALAATRPATRAELDVAEDEILVGTVGRLVAEKGFPELFAAFASLGPPYRLVVVGPSDPSKSDALDEAALRAAEESGVMLLGLRDDVPELFAAMDVFVLPSHREGFPRAAMEAAAMGLPIVATDIRGCREVVTDGHNGLLIPVRDEAAIASAIRRISSDPDQMAAMGHAGRQRALDEFDERRVVQRVFDAYHRVARDRKLTHLDRWMAARPRHKDRNASPPELVVEDGGGVAGRARAQIDGGRLKVWLDLAAGGAEAGTVAALLRAVEQLASEGELSGIDVVCPPGAISLDRLLRCHGFDPSHASGSTINSMEMPGK